MPENYAGDASTYPLTIPVVKDGEPASEAIFAPPYRKLADRTAYLHARAEPITYTALSLIVAPPDGAVRFVASMGHYYFQLGATADVDGQFVLSDPGGTGRWFADLYGWTGGSGIARTDSGSQLRIPITGGGFPTFDLARTLTRFIPARTYGGVRTGWANGFGDTDPGLRGPGTAQPQWLELGELHDGATLSSISLRFKPVTGRASLPTAFPRIELFRAGVTEGVAPIVESLLTGGFGHSFPAPASVAAYEDGNTKAITATLEAATSVINRRDYVYYLNVTDENGGGAISGNRYLGVHLTFTDITRLSFG